MWRRGTIVASTESVVASRTRVYHAKSTTTTHVDWKPDTASSNSTTSTRVIARTQQNLGTLVRYGEWVNNKNKQPTQPRDLYTTLISLHSFSGAIQQQVQQYGRTEMGFLVTMDRNVQSQIRVKMVNVKEWVSRVTQCVNIVTETAAVSTPGTDMSVENVLAKLQVRWVHWCIV